MAQNWYQKASVQAAFVIGFCGILAAIIGVLPDGKSSDATDYLSKVADRIDPNVVEMPFTPQITTDENLETIPTNYDIKSGEPNLRIYMDSAHSSKICNLRVSSKISVASLVG